MNLAQVKQDFDHQTLIGRATVGALIDHALALEAENKSMREDLNDARNGWETSAIELRLADEQVTRLRNALRVMYESVSISATQSASKRAILNARAALAVPA